jgi:hypothetical protein
MTDTDSFVPDAFWNEVYSQDGMVYGTEPNDFLADVWTRVKETFPMVPPEGRPRVLCIADGEGRNGVWLAKQGATVTAFDASDVAVAKAIKFAADGGVDDHISYSLSDCDGFAGWQPSAFDAIVGIFIQFMDQAMRQRTFERAYMGLTPGGLFVLQGYTPKQLEYGTGGPPSLPPLYTEDMIRDLALNAGFEIVELRCYEKILSEGYKHSGMSALLGLVARKPV